MPNALRNVNKKVTPQNERARVDQVRNNAGGYVFAQSDMQKLRSFLVLGTDNGTFYVGERDLTKQNVDFIEKMLGDNAQAVIDEVINVSTQGLAKSNDPALFVLALAINTDGIKKQIVIDAVQQVARTATHLFTYAQFLENLGGWGRAKRQSIAQWYENKRPAALGYQMVKYRQRNGWRHADLLRLSHAAHVSTGLARFALDKEFDVSEVPSIVIGFQAAQQADNVDTLVSIVQEYDLPWEAVPTQFHSDIKLWRGLFEADLLGQTALVRNITRLAKMDAFKDLSFAKQYADRLADQERINKGRVHPIQFLNAQLVYSEGQIDTSVRYFGNTSRNKTWETNGKILNALEIGFDNSFATVEPANKRTMVALDVSGSMYADGPAGLQMNCMQAAAFMGMFIARTEPYSEIVAFGHKLVDSGITEVDSFSAAMRKLERIPMGGTDCSIPMLHAQRTNRDIDTFVTITDNETWAGRMQPFQALKQYRQTSGIESRMAVIAMQANGFSIADPNDPGSMDFVGFDASAPKVLADFSAGRI